MGPRYDILPEAKKWIQGGTRTIIGVDVDPELVRSQCSWDLTGVQILENDLESLTAYIQNWHKRMEIPMVGLVETMLFILTEEEFAASAPPLEGSWFCTVSAVEGWTIGSVRRDSGINLFGDVVFKLPYGKITDAIHGALPDFQRERALLMATEALTWAFTNPEGGCLLVPFPV